MILIFILGLVALRILYSVGEVYYERDWPRDTWKGLLIALGVLCIAVSAFGQAARVDLPLLTAGPSVPISGGPLPQALWVANAAAYLCTHPSATLVACQAAPITTYTDSTEGTTCPTATPLVQLPGNTCTASTGTAANVGFWYGGGVFDYWIVSSYGTYGPFSGNSSNSALPSSCGNPTGIPCGGTGATTAAGANLNITGVTQTGTLGTSSQVSTFPGTVAAGTTTPTTMGSNGVLLNGVPALQAQTSLNNYYSGGAGNLTGTGGGNTANGFQALFYNTTGYNNAANGMYALYSNNTGYNNTANGFAALYANTTGSNNTANGFQALYYNTTGNYNTANGMYALYANNTGSSNTANGVYALQANTFGNYNTANGYQALAANTTGSNNTVNGFQAGQYIADGVTANQTSSNSVYEGFQAYPLASGDTNENVIGNTAIGHGSNTTTLGNTSTTGVYLNGALHLPAARKGTFVCTASGTITISNTNELATSDVIISLNTAGGTISTSPAMKTVTAGSGFTVLCGAGDTSTYNYDILN